MEMAQIKYVLAAARTLNFTRAAHECSVSQPALTKAVKNLESELGAPVFHREGKRISLSQFGKSMLPHFQHIIDETEVAHGLAQNFRLLNKVPVRLGVMSTVGHVRLARFLAQFERNHEGVELTVTEDALVDLAVKLRQGEVDIAILNGMVDPGEAMHMHELYTERYVVIFPPDHRLSACDAIRLSDLSGESYVDRLACEMRELVMEVCKEKNINLYARFRSEREDWVQAMVLARIGFAFVPNIRCRCRGSCNGRS